MRIPNVNLNYFKVFMAVYEARSMTGAAEALHLTQSGISQHVKALEEELGTNLFSRVGRKLIPTPLADQIYPDIAAAFIKVTERLDKVRGATPTVEGSVKIGMPVEFGTNVIAPKLAKIGQKYPKLTFEIVLDYASVLGAALLRGDLDFAYVDQSALDRRIQFSAVASEDLLLCASREYMAKKPKVTYTQAYFEGLEYIEYFGSDPILRQWMLHHLKRKNLRLNVRAHIMDVQGVAKFISSGLGAGVLPDHLVAKLKRDGVELHVFEGKAKPLRNEIRLIRLRGHPLSPQATTTLDELNAP